MRAGFFRQAGHTLSCSDRASKRAALSINPSQREVDKRAWLSPSAPGSHSKPEGEPGHHYKQEGYLDAYLSSQEGESSDDIASQPEGESQTDAHFSQQ